MRLSLAPWGETIHELVDAAREAERAGFETVWVSELHRSAFVPAAAIAAGTTSIGIGTAVALAFVRSPFTTGLTTLDLDELSGGRFTLGLAAGVRRLNEDWHGAAYGRPVPHLRETIQIVRRVVAEADLGERIDVDGEFESLHLDRYQRPFPPARRAVPVYVGAMAPHMLRLTGEIADGWISHELCSPDYVRDHTLPELELGLERAGRARSALQVVVSACCIVHNDRSEARRIARGQIAFYATVRSYQPFFELHGFADVLPVVRERFTAGDWEGMRDACPDELVDSLVIAGDPDGVRARLEEYRGVADVVKLSAPTQLVPPDVTREAQRRLFHTFGET